MQRKVHGVKRMTCKFELWYCSLWRSKGLRGWCCTELSVRQLYRSKDKNLSLTHTFSKAPHYIREAFREEGGLSNSTSWADSSIVFSNLPTHALFSIFPTPFARCRVRNWAPPFSRTRVGRSIDIEMCPSKLRRYYYLP